MNCQANFAGFPCELAMDQVNSWSVPPGFRFHPTEEELVGYYLARKVACQKIDLDVIQDVDLYRIEPWDLQDRCKYGHDQEQSSEWYFFSYKDRKYPSGTRTNRATAAGFWKATGRDKPVLSSSRIIGMRKTLVFYKGRAPNGRKTDWIMHEYRLQTTEHGPPQEEGWVVCRAFQKPTPSQRPYNCFSNFRPMHSNSVTLDHETPVNINYRSTCCFMDSSCDLRGNFCDHKGVGFTGDIETESKQINLLNHVLDIIPEMESPSLSTTSLSTKDCIEGNNAGGSDKQNNADHKSNCEGQLIDWKVLDKLLSSQFNESAISCSNMAPVVDYDAGAHSQAEHFLSLFDS